MPADKIFNITGGNPSNPGTGNTVTGESSVAFDTTSKKLKTFDGTTLYTFPAEQGGTLAAGSAKSGTAGTGAATFAAPGSFYQNSDTGVVYFNEGTLASPYWTPVSFEQKGLTGLFTDFGNCTGRLGTATTTSSLDASYPRLKYHGNLIDQNDATNTIQAITYPLDGPLLTMITENQDGGATVLGTGATTALWKPNVNGTMVIDVNFTGITDILTRSIFCGFSASQDAALLEPVTGSTTTLTFCATGTQGDNVHGLVMDSQLTAASTLFLASNAADAAATQTTASAALTVAGTVPAAGTYVRLRVEIDTDGAIRAFVNKVLVKTLAAGSATVGTALSPVFCQGNTTTTAALSLGVRHFGAWANR